MKINLDNSKQVMDAYMPLIVANARRFSVFEFDEAIDESKMILIDTILEYDEKKGTFGNFLKQKLYYHFLDKTKKIKLRSLDDFDNDGNPIIESVVDDYDIENDLIEAETNNMLYQKINNLPLDLKSIIWDKYFQHMTNRQIADKMNLSYKTIANKSSLALKILKNELSKE